MNAPRLGSQHRESCPFLPLFSSGFLRGTKEKPRKAQMKKRIVTRTRAVKEPTGAAREGRVPCRRAESVVWGADRCLSAWEAEGLGWILSQAPDVSNDCGQNSSFSGF